MEATATKIALGGHLDHRLKPKATKSGT